jgi:hypothetical protein
MLFLFQNYIKFQGNLYADLTRIKTMLLGAMLMRKAHSSTIILSGITVRDNSGLLSLELNPGDQ